MHLQANLLSSHRSLVHRVETIALGDKPCDRGEHVTLFLFNDCLEVMLSLSMSLKLNCSSECVYGMEILQMGSFLHYANAPSGSQKQHHYMKDISLDLWSCFLFKKNPYVKLLARFSLYCYYYTHISFE